MNSNNTSPYGSWKSPITSDLITQDTVGIQEVSFGGQDLYWLESLPTERGAAES